MSKHIKAGMSSYPHIGLEITTIYLASLIFILSLVLFSLICFSISPLAYKHNSQTSTYHTSWEKISSEAQQQNKLCLILFKTDFCHPCDALASELEMDTALFEDQFLICEVDAFSPETGGQDLAEMFDVYHLPTLLVTDADGKLLHRMSGAFQMKDLKLHLSALNSSHSPILSTGTSKPEVVQTSYFQGSGVSQSREVFGLRTDYVYDYASARQLALEQSYIWDKDIWIHSNRAGRYELILGAFDSETKANITACILSSWEGIASEVVTLKANSEIY